MKHLSVTLMVCGTIIVLAPIIHNLVLMAMLTHLLVLTPNGTFNLSGSLGSSYQGWCLFIGICLFITGIVSGFLSHYRAEKQVSRSVPLPLAAESNA